MAEPVRVLMLFTILNRGGAETMVMNYYRQIDRTKVQFDFVVHREERGAYEDEIEQLGGRIYRMMPLRPWTIPQYKCQIRKFFDERPEYRIIHGQCSELGYYFYQEAAKRGVPVIIAHAHNSHADYDLKWPLRTWWKYRMRRYLTHRFTCGIEAANWLFGHESAKTAILQRNAIDTESFRFNMEIRRKTRASLGIDDNTLVVGHVGRFEHQKNHPFVLRIFQQLFRQHPNSLLLLIGSGGDKENAVKDFSTKMHLRDSVRFLGSRSDMPQLFSTMDLFLLPSLMEGLPLAIVEAQCSGLPCVVSNGVPKEACMTDLVKRLSLEDNPEQWSETIIRQSTISYNRSIYSDQIAQAGYDIRQNTQWLQNLYIQYAHTSF